MPKFPLIAAASAAALILTGFALNANATPRPLAPGSAEILVLVEDEENAEVENLLEPEADQGTPMRDERAMEKPAGAPQGESAEKALESTVGGDGINAIQRESIPPE